jgi:hypothetical protein
MSKTMKARKRMKPFTIETPVLRLNDGGFYYWYRGEGVVCRNGLDELFQIDNPKRISFLLSSKYSRNAYKMTVFVESWLDYPDDVYLFWCDKLDEPTELSSGIADRWLSKHTPLGDLKPGESATIYVTLFVQEEK